MAEKPNAALLTYSNSAGRAVLVLSVHRAMLGFAALMSLFLLGNLLLACSTQFQCWKYLPTPGYLGCFRGHDRVFILSCTYYASVLPLVFTGLYSQAKASASSLEQWLLLGTAVGITGLLPLTALMNEVTSEHFLPFEAIYEWTSRCTVLFAFLWLHTAYKCLSRGQSVFTTREKAWHNWLRILVFLISFLYSLTLLAGYFPLLTDFSESLCEWVLCTLSVWAPAVLAQLVRGLHLSFSTLAVHPAGKELADLGKK